MSSERTDDLAGALVEHALVAALAALGLEVEDHQSARLDRHVRLAQGRQPVAEAAALAADPGA
jgi:hypothetical protein